MNEFAAWIQSNWYSLGNLLVQISFLAAGLWFARMILRMLRASQEQVGALLKLSVTGTTAERHSSSAAADRPFANASPYWLAPTEVPPVGLAELHESQPSRWAVAWHSLTVWLQKPMSSGAVHPWRKALHWLQAPAGH
jgi:hypothetical protein